APLRGAHEIAHALRRIATRACVDFARPVATLCEMAERDEELRESWFARRAPPDSTPSVLPAPRERSRSATWALGATTGAIGGVAGIFLATWATSKFGATLDIALRVGRALGQGREAGLAVAAIVGALFGGVLALTIRHGRRWIGRLIFASSACA